jgi:hypothetical protein
MADDIDIPKVGKLPKKYVIPLAVGVVGFIGWRVWQSRQEAAAADASPIADGEFGAVDTSIPGVIGAVSPTNAYGADTGSTADESASSITTNAAWTAKARGELNGTYSDSDIVAALGNYLDGRPLSTLQQQIVRSAIAVAGREPVGTHSIIPGGDTAISIAPTGLAAITIRDDHITLGWNATPGATTYRLYGNGGSVTTSSTQGTITGLKPGTSYSFSVAAVNGSGAEGPRSGTLAVKTSGTLAGTAPAPAGKRGYGWAQVQRGDSVKSFATRNGTTETAIRGLNSVSTLNRLTIGEWLKTRSTANPATGYKG